MAFVQATEWLGSLPASAKFLTGAAIALSQAAIAFVGSLQAAIATPLEATTLVSTIRGTPPGSVVAPWLVFRCPVDLLLHHLRLEVFFFEQHVLLVGGHRARDGQALSFIVQLVPQFSC